MVFALSVAFLIVPTRAWALPNCAAWSPNLSGGPKANEGSVAIELTWTNETGNRPPGACLNPLGGDTWDGTHHLEVHMEAGAVSGPCTLTATAPSIPSSATLVADLVGTADSADAYVQRASKDFAFRLFACENADCTSWYADGTGGNESVNSGTDDDGVCTEPEKWLLQGVATYSDTDRAIPDPANASGALFYPAGFYDGSTSLEGMLGIWWGEPESSSSTHDVIYHKRATATGAQGFNTYTGWDTTVEVARETGGTGAWSDIGHPWVAATHSGSTDGITMWVRQQRAYPDTTGEVLEFSSVDEEGADFGLECTDSAGCTVDGDACAYGDLCDFTSAGGAVAICADDTDTCAHLDHLKHGRVVWNYVGSGPIDFAADAPGMVATGKVTSSCTTVGLNEDEIYYADWTGSAWDVEDDAASTVCPISHFDDAHDPGVIPLPDGEFKMYVQQDGAGTDATEWVTYWNPSTGTWEDESMIVFEFDGTGYPDVDPKCVENMDALVYAGSSGVAEVMFVKAYAEGTGCFSTGGVIYAAKRN